MNEAAWKPACAEKIGVGATCVGTPLAAPGVATLYTAHVAAPSGCRAYDWSAVSSIAGAWSSSVTPSAAVSSSGSPEAPILKLVWSWPPASTPFLSEAHTTSHPWAGTDPCGNCHLRGRAASSLSQAPVRFTAVAPGL